MRNPLLCVLIIPVFLLTGCICTPVVKLSSKQQVVQKEVQGAYDEYFQLWNAGDAEAIARDSWTAPGWISLGTTIALPDVAAIETTYSDVRDSLRDRGWSHSKSLRSTVKVLNEQSALLETSWTRYLEDGSILEPPIRRGTYLYLKRDGDWRIAGLFMPE
ncbi:MAG: hypothetical protein MK085_05100 [Phycisphaerales bacterium]|nr:hypothetical protein [Phycisphaerales bacterium]